MKQYEKPRVLFTVFSATDVLAISVGYSNGDYLQEDPFND